MKKKKIKVAYFGLVSSVVGRRSEDLEVSEGCTVRELLELLGQKYGDSFRGSVLAKDGSLRSTVRISLNNLDMQGLQGLETKLGPKDEVTLVVVAYAMQGGALG